MWFGQQGGHFNIQAVYTEHTSCATVCSFALVLCFFHLPAVQERELCFPLLNTGIRQWSVWWLCALSRLKAFAPSEELGRVGIN